MMWQPRTAQATAWKALKPALGSVCIQLLRTSNMLLHSGMIAASSQFIALALAFYAVYLAVEE
jgi:hypothetical protein